MDGLLYPVSLLAVALLTFAFNRNNSPRLMLLSLAIGIYIIYSHESGKSITTLRDDIIESIDNSAREFAKEKGIQRKDTAKETE